MYARIALAVALAGCASWLPAPAPVHTLASRAYPDKQARCLLVLLPGMGDSDSDFRDHGFIDAIRARKISVDTISVNLTLGYYARQTLFERIEADILAPARAAGYSQIWFGGVSMGGLGSALVAERHAKELAGVILIAPYLGDNDVLTEIVRAGGVAGWQPPATIPKKDYQRELWRWLKSVTEQPDTGPAIYLAAGDRDKLALAHHLLAPRLPKERVFHTHGNHDWGPWSVLWADFLDHSDFRTRCAEE